MATDRLTRATSALVWATGVLAIATIALVLVTLSAAKCMAWRYEKVEAADELDRWTSNTKVKRWAFGTNTECPV